MVNYNLIKSNIVYVKSTERLSSKEYETISSKLKSDLEDLKSLNIVHNILELEGFDKKIIIKETLFLAKNFSLMKTKLKRYALVSKNNLKLIESLKFIVRTEIKVFKDEKLAIEWASYNY